MPNFDAALPIPNRALLTVSGKDAFSLLQRLVTVDLARLHPQDGTAYTLLLTPQGRYRFDFFVIRKGGGLFLDVPAMQAEALVNALNRYKLRAEAQFEPVAGLYCWLGAPTGDELAYADPRDPALGVRVWNKAVTVDDGAYKARRIALGIVEPSEDDCGDSPLPLELGLERGGAISFSKGCYLGQELTARTHNRDLVKYRVEAREGDPQEGERLLARAGTLSLVQRRR